MPLKIAVLGKSLPIKKKIYQMILIKKRIRIMVMKIEKEKLYGLTPLFIDFLYINAGKYFLKLINKHFKHDNILHKIFN